MSFIMAFGISSIMLCIGMLLRTRVKFFQNMLVPASVIAGLLGLIVMNSGFHIGTDAGTFTAIVNFLFTLTFISIGLTSSSSPSKPGQSAGKEIAKGSMGMAMVWNTLYALTPVLGAVILLVIGGAFGMHAYYGFLIPFSFAQGPGQAAAFGTIFEQQHGIENAAMVGLTFSVIAYIACFLIGVPLAKYGIKKGLAKNFNHGQLDGYIKRGYFKKEEEREAMGKETVYSGNMDTMTFHFAMMGICYVIALGISEFVSYIPVLGESFSGFVFIYGMIAGYAVKYVMNKLKIDHLLDNTFQTKLTNWSTDYLVVASFMAVQFSVIAAWAAPILIMSVATVFISFILIMYFGKRFGGDDDFARTLGIYGASIGTVPSGIALIRIMDPSLRTSVAVELGLMNIPMTIGSMITVSTIFSVVSGAVPFWTGILLILAPIPVYLIIMKALGVWGKKTYELGGIRRKRRSALQ
ncbi:sodium:glutamate symporter [Candidatus Pseudothioglobus singularis]|nr:sodium:glutamate symporter [Candidatus Pseudothioglobus singularis]